MGGRRRRRLAQHALHGRQTTPERRCTAPGLVERGTEREQGIDGGGAHAGQRFGRGVAERAARRGRSRGSALGRQAEVNQDSAGRRRRGARWLGRRSPWTIPRACRWRQRGHGQLGRGALERRPDSASSWSSGGFAGDRRDRRSTRSPETLRPSPRRGRRRAPARRRGARERLQPRELVERDPTPGHVGREDLCHARRPLGR